MTDHGCEFGHEPLGNPAGYGQLVFALEFLDRRTGRLVKNAGRFDLAIAVVGQTRCTAMMRGDGPMRSAIGSLRRTGA